MTVVPWDQSRGVEAPFGRDKEIVGDPERREGSDICFEGECKRRIF